MVLEELFENGVSMVKTVWKKRGNEVLRQDIKRIVATDIQPRSHIEIQDQSDGS